VNPSPKRALLITGHYFDSKRKAGFHWLAEALWRAGWEVIFVTTAISWMSWLQRNYRMAYPIFREAHRLRWVRERLGSYVWLTPWHPVDLRYPWLNRLAHHLFARYGQLSLGALAPLARETDLFVFESKPGLMLFDRLRQLNPRARLIYRVSDDLRLLRTHRVVLDTESRIAPQFDLISVPNAVLLHRFEHLSQAVLHHHGICKSRFDQDYPNPYTLRWKAHLVFVGTAYLDHDFIDRASAHFPTWAFHLIGPLAGVPRRANIFAYGEMPFDATIPYLKHADIGLHTLICQPGAASFADSLKVIQYTYCRLPIVAPEPLRSSRANMFYYQPGDAVSMVRALEAARAFDRRKVDIEGIHSWASLARVFAKGL
jgi:2-beta-glucuronyltransferase